MIDQPNADPATEVQFRWLGQAGFAVRGPSGTVAFDPYLSDFCRTVFGLERTVAAPCAPADVGAQLVLVSHWHEDHLDLDSAAEFVESGATFIAPPSCVARLVGRGIPVDAVRAIGPGDSVDLLGMTVTAVPAMHRVAGFLTEDAVGYVLDIDGTRIYHSGDTEYHRTLLAAGDRGPVDAALLCVNGTGGNMNAFEAALLATQLQPALVVPMHFGMWEPDAYGPGGTLDPAEFADIYTRVRAGAAVHIPRLDAWHPVRNNR